LSNGSNVYNIPGEALYTTTEGNAGINNAILYLQTLPAQKSLNWNDKLYSSAKAHVADIGPQGLTTYNTTSNN